MKSFLMLLSIFTLTNAFAGGYEKAVMWSGKWGALGGAAVAGATGADAVFFNPAGMIGGPEAELGINASLTQSQFKGPGSVSNQSIDGEKLTSVLPSLLYKRNHSDTFSYGIGVAAIAGSKALYENVGSIGTDLSTDIQAVEVSLSVARKLNKNLNMGFSWRITDVKGAFDSQNTSSGGFGVKAEDLEQTDTQAFRLGFQYTADSKKWGWGATYRSEVSFELDNGKATVEGAGVNGTGDIKATSTLPQSLAFGTWYQMNEKSRLYTELTWWEYSANEEIGITFSNMTGTAAALTTSAIPQHWKDMYALKMGYEYMKDETLALRAGAAITTQVTNKDYARNTFSAPGPAYSVHFGAGKTIGSSTVDLGLEYVISKGEGEATPSSQTLGGDFESYAYAFHAGYKYAF